MNKYGELALLAAKYYETTKCPIEAWEKGAKKIFDSTESQKKGCPKSTFLGLCEEGLIFGVKRGSYTTSDLNKKYALKAVKYLVRTEVIQISPKNLWEIIQNNNEIKHNSQMDVVLALWNNNLITQKNKAMSNLFFGNPPGVQENDWFSGRKDLINAGLHRSTQHGIDGNGNEGVAAIVLSGGYEDDRDLGDEIIYTGHGGNKDGIQIEHQSWDAHGNKGLAISKERNLPVRVIRGYNHSSPFSPKSGYSYSGLFEVKDYWDEIGKSGFKICRFKLVKIIENSQKQDAPIKEGCIVLLAPSGKDSKWFSIGVDAPNAQKISAESKMAQLLIGSKTGDIIDFGSGFKVLEIKKYRSK